MLPRVNSILKLPDDFKLSESMVDDLKQNRFSDVISLEDFQLDDLKDLSCYRSSNGMYHLYTAESINSFKVENDSFVCPMSREVIRLNDVFKLTPDTLKAFIQQTPSPLINSNESTKLYAGDAGQSRLYEQTISEVDHQALLGQDLNQLGECKHASDEEELDRDEDYIFADNYQQNVQRPELYALNNVVNYLGGRFAISLYIQTANLEFAMVGNALVMRMVQHSMQLDLVGERSTLELSLHSLSNERASVGYMANGLFGARPRSSHMRSAERAYQGNDARSAGEILHHYRVLY